MGIPVAMTLTGLGGFPAALPEIEEYGGFADSNFICFPYETRRTAIYAVGTVHQAMTIPMAMNGRYRRGRQGHPGGGARGRRYGGAPPGLGLNLP